MAYLNLSGPELKRTTTVFQSTFALPGSLQQLVLVTTPELGPVVNWSQPLSGLIFDVVRAAENYGVTSQLLLAAMDDRPNRPDLRGLVIELTAGKRGRFAVKAYGSPLEEIVHNFAAFLDPALISHKLVCHEQHVCMIDTPQGGGTGLLVARDLVLTNYHVVEQLLAGSYASDKVRCVFDYRNRFDGSANTTISVGLDPAWTIPHRKYEEYDPPTPVELDYALLRLDTPIGEASIGEPQPRGVSETRCWFDLSHDPPDPVNDRLTFILQHPGRAIWAPGEPHQEPLKVALGQPGFDGYNANKTRIRYRANTLPGSSGSAVFDEKLRLVALHNSRGVTDANGQVINNQGIPLKAILADLPPDIRALLVKPNCNC